MATSITAKPQLCFCGITLLICNGVETTYVVGTLIFSKTLKSATFNRPNEKPVKVRLPEEQIRRWHEALVGNRHKSIAPVLLYCKQSFPGPYPNDGGIEVFPFSGPSERWYLAVPTEDHHPDSELCLYQNGKRCALTFSDAGPRMDVFQMLDGQHWVLYTYEEGAEEQEGHSEFTPGGACYFWPVEPCPPEEAPPRWIMTPNFQSDGQRYEFEKAILAARTVFYLFGVDIETFVDVELLTQSRHLQLIGSDDCQILIVGAGFNKDHISLKIDQVERELTIETLELSSAAQLV